MIQRKLSIISPKYHEYRLAMNLREDNYDYGRNKNTT